MRVYFNQNFWDTREGLMGIPKKVNWEFTYENQHYYIPMIYQFPEGITIDIISLLDTAKLKEFREKYEYCINNMSEDDRHYIEAESPIQELPLRKVYVNNELAELKGSCSSCYIAGMNHREKENVLEEIQRENNFLQGEDISFQCMRVHIKFLKDSQSSINTIKFITSKTEYLIPIKKHFKLDIDICKEECEEVFVHPLTGIKHHIYINEVKANNARDMFSQYDKNDPFNFAVVSYELVPALPGDERLLLNEIKQPDEVKTTTNNKKAAAIGVIFGNSKNQLGIHGYPLETSSTRMYWKSLKSIEINIVGIYKNKCSEEEILVYDSLV